MDELEQKHLALVKRISGYPIPEAARAAILAQVEAIYRQEGAVVERGAGRAPASRGRELPQVLKKEIRPAQLAGWVTLVQT